MDLTKKQIKQLKALAHNRKPVIMVGQNGITDNLLAELEIALNHHELIKVKIAGADRESRAVTIQSLCESSRAITISSIGSVCTLYRANAKAPVIKLTND